ncbi:hypothetical protein PFICI_13712 [Pestalotiopsis fici W106-1]|uniref:Uncharacterized protein n=1 Tax=Pestalotiopsis fici (strain W106-1 / CGMCC3.15140) TaxID=1229662 RepID=W3WN15_PESFW|nr:uncharacterized protein PFICI_13712 [Pestalotiopsis fici W106-1]ETS75228.1 hypothetical protein PFICI_13712 [Pestalotiopsis fici W106-1]
MASSIGHNHEASAENQDKSPSQGSRDLVISWLDKVYLHARNAETQSIFSTAAPSVPVPMASSPGREGMFAAQRDGNTLCLPAGAHTHQGPAALNPLAHCYRLRDDGVAIEAPGHPFTCACSDNARLHSARESESPTTPVPTEACLYPPIPQSDKREIYLNLAMQHSAGIFYPLEGHRIMSHNPLKLNKYRARLLNTPLALESVLAVGALMHPEGSGASFAAAHAAFIDHMISDCISEGTFKSDLMKHLILQ